MFPHLEKLLCVAATRTERNEQHSGCTAYFSDLITLSMALRVVIVKVLQAFHSFVSLYSGPSSAERKQTSTTTTKASGGEGREGRQDQRGEGRGATCE